MCAEVLRLRRENLILLNRFLFGERGEVRVGGRVDSGYTASLTSCLVLSFVDVFIFLTIRTHISFKNAHDFRLFLIR